LPHPYFLWSHASSFVEPKPTRITEHENFKALQILLVHRHRLLEDAIFGWCVLAFPCIQHLEADNAVFDS
jgi:hypothetical protein